jgi:hypothetical protein
VRAALVVLCAMPAVARAETFAAVTLPSRGEEAVKVEERARRIAGRLAAAHGGRMADPAPSATAADIATMLARADELSAQGDLDEAAKVLDDGLEVGVGAPHRFAASRVFVGAHVTRARIALARGESDRAGALFERLVRWDPTFGLEKAEASPRLEKALRGARARVGSPPALRPEDLGEACALADVIVVARALGAQRYEFARIEGCRERARAVVGPGGDDALLRALGAPEPRPVIAAPPPPPPEPPPSLWRRPWFWGAVAAVVVGAAGVVVWQVSSDPDQVDVVPHL